jgi:hypothetical protein
MEGSVEHKLSNVAVLVGLYTKLLLVHQNSFCFSNEVMDPEMNVLKLFPL